MRQVEQRTAQRLSAAAEHALAHTALVLCSSDSSVWSAVWSAVTRRLHRTLQKEGHAAVWHLALANHGAQLLGDVLWHAEHVVFFKLRHCTKKSVGARARGQSYWLGICAKVLWGEGHINGMNTVKFSMLDQLLMLV